jgi:hypothetical protein
VGLARRATINAAGTDLLLHGHDEIFENEVIAVQTVFVGGLFGENHHEPRFGKGESLGRRVPCDDDWSPYIFAEFN